MESVLGMSKNKSNDLIKKKQSQAGKKAARTRKERERHEQQVERGLKADKTRQSSEFLYVNELAKVKKIDASNIFHHEGLPDLVAVAPSGKLIFCEMKPKNGPVTKARSRFQRKMGNLRDFAAL